MPSFESSQPFAHGLQESLGVLLINLGTPDEPSTSAVRRYLDEFLSDPRVVELPRLLWWLILHGFILRFRPSRSAAQYRKIWTDKGSPLLVYSQALAAGVGDALSARLSGSVNVVLAMSYGQPSIDTGLQKLFDNNARRIIALPLYPQYSGTTTGSVFDAITGALSRRRWVPEFRFINHYHDATGYIEAVADSVREFRSAHGAGDRLLFSFHGLPERTLTSGDPYHCQCHKTARLVAEALELGADEWQVSFQSRVGREQWLTPYTEQTVRELGAQKLDKLDVICPGFAVDCLETLEEIEIQNAEFFRDSGGGELRYVPALNARDDHVAFLAGTIAASAGGWPEAATVRNFDEEAQQLGATAERAMAMGADR